MCSALLTIVVALQAPGRNSGATVTGQVRGAQGAPVAAALVEATASLADVWSNREGRFELRRLPFGTVHFQVRALGLELRVPEVVPVLNRWADSATSGKIHEIRKKKFADSVEVALTNAVYFKGRWLGPFDSTLTKERPFTWASGNRVRTPTMQRTERLAYRRGHEYRAVRLPYMSGLTALYVALPDSG